MDISKDFFEHCIINSINQLSIPVNTLDNLCSCNNYTHDKHISITFDDGWESDYKIAFPVLLDNKMKATFFITTNWIGEKHYLRKSWIKEMSDYGMEIGSHTVSHRYLTELSEKEIQEELYASKCRLEDISGRGIYGMSAPGGECNESILHMAKKTGYKIIGTSYPGINHRCFSTVQRVKLHATTTESTIRNLLSFSSTHLYRLQISFFLRFLLKKFIGLEQYTQLRKKISKHDIREFPEKI